MSNGEGAVNVQQASQASAGTKGPGETLFDTNIKPKRRVERKGQILTGACVLFVVVVVATLIYMVCSRGLSTFLSDGVSPASFFLGTTWNPHQASDTGELLVGALPMIFVFFFFQKYMVKGLVAGAVKG